MSHPEVRKFIRKSLTDRVAEGFRYFKLDFLWIRGETLAKRFDQKKTRLQLARDVCQLYREAIGEDSYLLSCVGGYNRGTYGYADAARIGTDTSAAFKKLYDGVCMADCLNATGSTAWSNGILFANDPDVTYLHMGDSEVKRTWLGYVGLLGGLALTSEPLNQLDAAAIRNFEILIPPAPDKGRAFDGQTDPWHRRFGFVAQRPWGNFASMLLWNPEDEPADVSLAGVPLASLGSKFHAWSFWDEKYLGLVDADWVARELPTHGSRVLRFTAADEKRPVLIGSTLHIGMGSAEMKRCEASTAGIGIELTDAGARDGSLFIFHRGTLALASAEGCEASLSAAGENVWRLSITGRQRGTPNFLKIDHRP